VAATTLTMLQKLSKAKSRENRILSEGPKSYECHPTVLVTIVSPSQRFSLGPALLLVWTLWNAGEYD